jgi:hypothetical protein
MGCLASVAGGVSAQDRAVTTAKSEEDRIVPADPAIVEADGAPGPIQFVPLAPGTVFQRYTVFADDADVAAAVSEQLVYSNTLGTFMAALGGGNLVSDDVTITVPNGCKLTRYEFPVVGKVDPTGIGGDYFVDFALYRICPGSLQVGSRPSQIIPGTQGRKTFTGAAANAPGLISFVAGPNVALQTNMWLGVNFSRGNAGVIVGTPALQGFSCDQFDFPGSPCDSRLGGFPDQPQASFNLEIYADSACSASFTGYKNDKPSGSTFNPGQDVVFADDIQLVNGSCNVIAYEIAVKGVGFYTFDLRPTCEGPAIPGTEQTFQVGFGTDVKIARLIIDPPVPLPQNLWFGAKISVATGQVVIAGQQACIGQTADLIEFVGDHGCEIVPATIIGAGIHGAFSLSITCAGPAPVGACCDMFLTECQGGPNAGSICVGKCTNSATTRCKQDSDCPTGGICAINIDCNLCSGGTQNGKPCDPLIPAAQNLCNQGGGNCPVQGQGTCESVCRNVPQTNCAFPPRFSEEQPGWVEHAACEPDPFGNHPCGQAACCYADQQGDECTNLTPAACKAAGDLTRPRQWQIGRYCNDGGQFCPRNACLGRTGECTLPRCEPQASVCSGGTNNGQPCTTNAQCPGVNARCAICGGNNCHVGPTCCDSCPPIGCENADCCTTVCNYLPDGPYCCDVEWDEPCASLANEFCPIQPANDVCVPVPAHRLEGARLLVISPLGFVSAETDSGRATEDADDPGFGCYKNNPGAQGLQTVWYKFVATQTSALFQTCQSNAPADDSLLEVFAVGDMSTPLTQCHSLIPIGCSDDFPGCSDSNTNSKICIQSLVPGNLYYVLVAAKTRELPGKKYRLDISSPCQCSGGVCDPVINDDCPRAITITDGTTHFGPNDLPKATVTAPIESCMPNEKADVWYRYTATCTGTLTVETCGASAPASPDTNLAIYDRCPTVLGLAPIACSTDAGGDCGQGSKIEIDVVQGTPYIIRLADEAQNGPEGDLKVTCVQAHCPAGEMTIISPPDKVVDAGRPSDPSNAALLQGIKTITAIAPHAALRDCFTLCDTAFPVPDPANSVVSAVEVEAPPGTYTYTITLARPITAGALTTLTYTDVRGLQSTGRFSSHPANVDADLFAQSLPPSDVQRLVDTLNGTFTPPWGIYSGDIDRSAGVTPADILEVVDLLNGAGVYIPWEGTDNPSSSPFCP